MNAAAATIGIKDSLFKTPHGLPAPGQSSTVRDLMVLGHRVLNTPEITQTWGVKAHRLDIRGANSRHLQLRSTVQSVSIERDYLLLGGKTGTLKMPNGGRLNNLLIHVESTDGRRYLSVLIGARGNRFLLAKHLLDRTQNTLSAKPPINMQGRIQAGSIAIVSGRNNALEAIVSINETVPIVPASLTKLLTCIVMLNAIDSLDEEFEVRASDITVGSGPLIRPGDRLSFRDALYGILLSSSNTIATAVARTIGDCL
jgi:D-alanyl-D-alanine carboxypeptidase